MANVVKDAERDSSPKTEYFSHYQITFTMMMMGVQAKFYGSQNTAGI